MVASGYGATLLVRAKRAAKTGRTATPTAVPTFAEIADDFIATHEGSWRSEKHRWQWRQTLGDAFCSPIRAKPVNEIGVADVLAVLKPVWSATPETASRLRGRIEAVLDAARAHGHIAEDKANPARWKGHLDKLLPKRSKLTRGHQRAMPHADVPAFVAELRALEYVAARALEFVVLTATRTSGTLNARFDEFDLDANVWTIPSGRMKSGREHRVPLSDRAVEILRAESKLRTSSRFGPHPFVFPGARPGQPLSNMALAMVMRRLKVDATVHGARSSFCDWASEAGVDFETAEMCLAHAVGNAVTRSYLRTTMIERRRVVMQRWATFVSGETAKVVRLPTRRARRAGA